VWGCLRKGELQKSGRSDGKVEFDYSFWQGGKSYRKEFAGKKETGEKNLASNVGVALPPRKKKRES